MVRGEELCWYGGWVFFRTTVLKIVGKTYAMCQKHHSCLIWASHNFLASIKNSIKMPHLRNFKYLLKTHYTPSVLHAGSQVQHTTTVL